MGYVIGVILFFIFCDFYNSIREDIEYMQKHYEESRAKGYSKIKSIWIAYMS